MEYCIVPTNLKESLTVLQQYFATQKRKSLTQVFFKKHNQFCTSARAVPLNGIRGKSPPCIKRKHRRKTNMSLPIRTIQWATFKVCSPRERGNSYYTENEISQS